MRLELIHPMLVHFPIALLTTGVVLRFVSLWSKKRPNLSFLLPSAWLILALGVIAAWLAVIAGEVARDIVATPENRAILDEHREHAYTTAIGFTISLLLDWTRAFLATKSKRVNRILGVVVGIIYLFCWTNLLITAYYGGTLVFEKGAAVIK